MAKLTITKEDGQVQEIEVPDEVIEQAGFKPQTVIDSAVRKREAQLRARFEQEKAELEQKLQALQQEYEQIKNSKLSDKDLMKKELESLKNQISTLTEQLREKEFEKVKKWLDKHNF